MVCPVCIGTIAANLPIITATSISGVLAAKAIYQNIPKPKNLNKPHIYDHAINIKVIGSIKTIKDLSVNIYEDIS